MGSCGYSPTFIKKKMCFTAPPPLLKTASSAYVHVLTPRKWPTRCMSPLFEALSYSLIPRLPPLEVIAELCYSILDIKSYARVTTVYYKERYEKACLIQLLEDNYECQYSNSIFQTLYNPALYAVLCNVITITYLHSKQ